MIDRLADEVRRGAPRALPRALSVVENGGEEARRLLTALGRIEPPHVIGVTGPPGSGKSTLVEALGPQLLGEHGRLGVLAVDPSSPFSGGALLGDRLRMTDLAALHGVFVRSMATRGALGGLTASTADAVDLLGAAGFPVVVIETVGVGQDEVDIMHLADTVLLTLPPGAGDDVQAAKAGVMEIAHVVVVTKADQPGAERVEAHVTAALELAPRTDWLPPVVRVSAAEGAGIAELAEAVEAHRRNIVSDGRGEARRVARAERRVRRAVEDLAWVRVSRSGQLPASTRRVAAGAQDPYSAAERLVEELTASGTAVELDHVGIAVASLEGAAGIYRAAGLEESDRAEVPEQGVRVAFFPAGGARVELLEPLDETSPIAVHLKRRGPGLHHIALRIPDIVAAMERLRNAGYRLLSDEPQAGAHGCLVCFIHPKSAGGVLMELTQTGAQ